MGGFRGQSDDLIAKLVPARRELPLAAVNEFVTLRRTQLGRQLPGESLSQVIEGVGGRTKYGDPPRVHGFAVASKAPAPERRNQTRLNEGRLTAPGVSDDGRAEARPRRVSNSPVSWSRPKNSQESSRPKVWRLRNGLCVVQYSAWIAVWDEDGLRRISRRRPICSGARCLSRRSTYCCCWTNGGSFAGSAPSPCAGIKRKASRGAA